MFESVKEYECLAEKGNIGFYERAEITTIFLSNKIDKKIYNYFSIIVFEEFNNIPNTIYLTSNLIKVNKQWNIGIVRQWESIADISKLYNNLASTKKWIVSGNELNLVNLRCLPKQFVPNQATEKIPLNHVLKNNFFNGSYVIEFFAEDKGFYYKNFTRDELDKINVNVMQIIPINLDFMSDRIGNIMFQFPIEILMAEHRSLKSKDGLDVNIIWHPKVKQPPEVRLTSLSELDQNVLGFGETDSVNSKCEVKSGNTQVATKFLVYNPNSNLIYHKTQGTFIGSRGNITVRTATSTIEKRIIRLDSKMEVIDVRKTDERWNPGTDYIDHISSRIRDNEKKELEVKKTFIQYCKNGQDERQKALSDIRGLINSYGHHGVYLWDPYLDSQDIIETIYFCSHYGVEMKALTSYTRKNSAILNPLKKDYNLWVNSQIKILQNSSNNIGINLEVRCKHESYGWQFHDRFLIFPSKLSLVPVRAWSLGASVNSLGKKHHHIIQEVPNSALIKDAFDTLWNALSHSDCLVWRS